MTTIQYKIPNYSNILYLIFFLLFVVMTAFWTFLFIDRYNLTNEIYIHKVNEKILENKLQNVDCGETKLLKNI